jgi:hypothetical protein
MIVTYNGHSGSSCLCWVEGVLWEFFGRAPNNASIWMVPGTEDGS